MTTNDDDEMKTRARAVREAFAQLQPHHLAWLIDWTLKASFDRVRATQAEITRLEHFGADELTQFGTTSEPDTAKDARARLEQYRAIHVFLARLRDAINFAHALDFVDAMRRSGLLDALFGSGKGR